MAYRKNAPASLTLPYSEQAEVNRRIEKSGLDSTEFVWTVQPSLYELAGTLMSTLIHTPTGATFKFEFFESAVGMNRVSIFEPGECNGQQQIKAAAS